VLAKTIAKLKQTGQVSDFTGTEFHLGDHGFGWVEGTQPPRKGGRDTWVEATAGPAGPRPELTNPSAQAGSRS